MLKIKKIENKNEVSVEAQNIGCWFDCNKKINQFGTNQQELRK